MSDGSAGAGPTDARAVPEPLFARGELLSAVSAVLLLVLLITTAWYGADVAPSEQLSGAERVNTQTGWHALSATRWLIVLLVLVAVGSLIWHIAERRLARRTDTSSLIAVLATITALWVTVRTLIDLPAPSTIVDVKLGGYLGMLSAYGVAIGGYQYLRAVRLAGPSATPDGAPGPGGTDPASTGPDPASTRTDPASTASDPASTGAAPPSPDVAPLPGDGPRASASAAAAR